MRCDEVMRELNLPSDDRDDRALAAHLAECKACSRWLEHGSTFQRLWDATRPADPSTESWDGLWSSVTARLDHSGPATRYSRPDHALTVVGDATPLRSSPLVRSWRGLAAIGLVGLAQAAALLLAVNLYWKTGNGDVQPPRSLTTPEVTQLTGASLDPVVDVEWGQTIVIRSEGHNKVATTDLALIESSSGEDTFDDLFNHFEAGSTDVASRE